MEELLDRLRRAGERPFVVPLGGSCALGAIGYVLATREILEQLVTDDGSPPARLYHASGSRGTQAGLELGARLFGAPWRVIGVAVSGGEVEKRERAARIMTETAALLECTVEFEVSELQTEQRYYGEGYGVPTREGSEAIRLLARTEGLFLDPVYTAKAMACLIDHVRSARLDPDGSVVFLHTGGVPALFALPGARTD
jgi:1-aminocyclopropane-1-carboxylate deaminase/D-cysteine desulfhydrase-like pyridoxal-dependent ACC family enzyme